ncbi:MAG TPA: hypothetical protein VHK01_08850 [Lacipirellulaceae bacterium]|nr:hypothetical protein [Lacipirellulaceae bacterium]
MRSPNPQLILADDAISSASKAWLGPQNWVRDLDEPTLSLGEPGAFDDTHLFAPMVLREDDHYRLWYCGSTGLAHDVAPTRVPDRRLFKIGLATSDDGLRFKKYAANPIFQIDSHARSILTPTILRDADGRPVREAGKLRMWFTSGDLSVGAGGYVLQEASSADGIAWSQPSEPQLEKAYAPSVVKTDYGYHLWYTDVTSFPWNIRHAQSKDGKSWSVTPTPVMTLTQPWEQRVLVYPCVLHIDGRYLMWYGSYLSSDRQKTAIGFAVSEDGVTWHKHPDNPVLRPQDDRPWESHYVTSQSVIRLPDGRFRMWYASRKAPPFVNLYFAINSATWDGTATQPTR